MWAFESLIYRANKLGAFADHHFLFPIRQVRNCYDPTRPMGDSALKKPWDEVRKAANMPWLRLYDLRHTAITRMAENGIPIPVILSFAGHVSQKMQQHYTQISMMAQRKAAASTWAATAPPMQMIPDRKPHMKFPPRPATSPEPGTVYGRRASDRIHGT